MRRLNALGYGSGRSDRILTLVTNPVGAFLPAGQASMEREWKEALGREHGVSSDRLMALNDMPISRYLEWLETSGNLETYLKLLVDSFNPATLAGLMCRNTIPVSRGWLALRLRLQPDARAAGPLCRRAAPPRPQPESGSPRGARHRHAPTLLRVYGRCRKLLRRGDRELNGGAWHKLREQLIPP